MLARSRADVKALLVVPGVRRGLPNRRSLTTRGHIERALGRPSDHGVVDGCLQNFASPRAPRPAQGRLAQRQIYASGSHDPAALVRLPAMNATPIERVASPAEFAQLLAVLPLEMALPYALAGYGMGRRVQIIHLDWTDVDLELGALEWGARLEARKYDASQRVVPIVAPLAAQLRRRFLELGRPQRGLVCPPLTSWASSGLLNTGWLARRAQEVWDRAQLRRITLQEARHTASTWLDAAGVSPKVASVLMGHAVPERQPGAATITLARYTHALPEDIARAGNLLAAYLRDNARSAARDQGR